MLITYDIEKINTALHDFYSATGARIMLYDENFLPISFTRHELCGYCRHLHKKYNCKKECIKFDNTLMKSCKKRNKTIVEHCPFGLLNSVIPIDYNNTILGYLYYGQIKTSNIFPSEFFEDKPDYILDAGLRNYYDLIPLFTPKQINGISNLSKMLIKFLLTENLVIMRTEEVLEKCIQYINENIGKELTIARISKDINVSKTVLYTKFRSQFNLTIGEYVNQERIKKSIELLLHTNLSIEQISQQIGFSSAAYFTKIFKQQMDVTPLKFRKQQSL